MVLCSLALLLSFLCFPRVLWSAVFHFSLYLFIVEGSVSLVSISGLRPLPGWGPPPVNIVLNVHRNHKAYQGRGQGGGGGRGFGGGGGGGGEAGDYIPIATLSPPE